jgi:hypothetical protein
MNFRLHLGVRIQNQAAVEEFNRLTVRTEDFASDEEACEELAKLALVLIQTEREGEEE